MNYVDYLMVIAYFIVMIVLGFMFKKSKLNTDYFLGGKQFGWFALCLSTMATQLSVISFISAPAFVGLRKGGGMQWLTFEFGVPIAMIILIAFIAPVLYRSGVVSVYEFLEKRFNRSSRLLVSVVFLISRSFATSVTIYAVTLILTSILNLSFIYTIIIISVVTIFYSLEGGMKAIVYSEVAQMLIKVSGIGIIIFFGYRYAGGWDVIKNHLDFSRLNIINFQKSGFDGSEYGFWPMMLGGIFLYCSYYGTDQSQVQRILSAKDETTVKKLLLFNGLFRFPITFCYCIGGLILGVFVSQNAAFAAKIPENKPDLMIPVFITNYLPHGIIGIIVVAIIAAAMSSFSSNINSLTAVTMEDFVTKRIQVKEDKYVGYSKMVGLIWGLITVVLAFFMGNIAKTVIEAINKIGSVFYGPIVAIFFIAIFTKSVKATAANIGLVAGVFINLFFWIFCKNIFWFWWNVIGFCTALLVTTAVHYVDKSPKIEVELGLGNIDFTKHLFSKYTLYLVSFFIAILCLCLYITSFSFNR